MSSEPEERGLLDLLLAEFPMIDIENFAESISYIYPYLKTESYSPKAGNFPHNFRTGEFCASAV